jgi:cytochrome c biogenesis protein CcdA
LVFGGGLVSFLSPCVLPLVPVYLSMVTGLEGAEIQLGARVHFIAGFSGVFILLGLSTTTLGRAAFARWSCSCFGVLLALNRMVWVTTQFGNALAAIGLERGLHRQADGGQVLRLMVLAVPS